MDVFVGDACLLCEDCGIALREKLEAQGKAPEFPDDETTYDSSEYPKGPYADGGGESDSPSHCDHCHCFLENSLTRDGLEYVNGALREYVAQDGLGAADVLDLWAEFCADNLDKFTLIAYEAVRRLERNAAAAIAALSQPCFKNAPPIITGDVAAAINFLKN